jgi:signal transduction histidine kinase
MPFRRALLALIVLAVLAGALPTGALIDRWVGRELDSRVREAVTDAPRMLADRNVAIADAMTMHAKELAQTPGLARALGARDRVAAQRALDARPHKDPAEGSVVVGADGSTWMGPTPEGRLIDSTRRSATPVVVIPDGRSLAMVALAPVFDRGTWVGAAGVSRPLDRGAADVLAGLTRSDVVILAPDGNVAAATVDSTLAEALRAASLQASRNETRIAGQRYFLALAPLSGAASVVFARNVDRELALLPRLRRVLAASWLGALAVTLALGAVLARRLSRPVEQLAAAADRLASGDFAAPLGRSEIREVERLSQAFDTMREVLAARLHEIEAANVALEERTQRLAALQAELMQRDRLAATGHLVVQLAHEIRNPVAAVRNCLELIRRRIGGDAEAMGFADLAVGELMRMHALAEQLLDLNRPGDPGSATCDPLAVAREVASLTALGDGDVQIEVTGLPDVRAAIAGDALKQVLINLSRNAREAHGTHLEIDVRVDGVITVADDGPGIPAGLLPRIFDPFVSTKTAVHGVGLGLFVAEGLIRSAGGRIQASNRADGHGAVFTLDLPVWGRE